MTTIPRDKFGDLLVWPNPNGDGWIDAWNGWYPDLGTVTSECGHWSAREEDRVLAHGEGLITEGEADKRRERNG